MVNDNNESEGSKSACVAPRGLANKTILVTATESNTNILSDLFEERLLLVLDMCCSTRFHCPLKLEQRVLRPLHLVSIRLLVLDFLGVVRVDLKKLLASICLSAHTHIVQVLLEQIENLRPRIVHDLLSPLSSHSRHCDEKRRALLLWIRVQGRLLQRKFCCLDGRRIVGEVDHHHLRRLQRHAAEVAHPMQLKDEDD